MLRSGITRESISSQVAPPEQKKSLAVLPLSTFGPKGALLGPIEAGDRVALFLYFIYIPVPAKVISKLLSLLYLKMQVVGGIYSIKKGKHYYI